MKIAIFHNILWSKYKGGVFSALQTLCTQQGVQTQFTQIAETEGERSMLSGLNLAYHRYEYRLLFAGAYSSVPKWRRVLALVQCAWKTDANLVILPGYERLEYWAMLATLVLRQKPRAVFCDSTAYDRPYSYWKALAKRFFFARCQGFFGYGQRSKEYLMMLGAQERKIFFRCQAAALPLNYSESKAHAERLRAQLTRYESPLFIYVGRLSTEKGLFTLLLAMKALVDTHTNARLRLIGAGPLQKSLADEIIRLQLQDNVVLSGSMDVEQLAEQYSAADALILPSTSEPWGLVANEALSHGCPIIVSNQCGCAPELVVSGITGYSFETGDVLALTARMIDSLNSLKDVQSVASQCINHMRQFTPERAAVQILTGCRQMLQESGSAP